MDTGADRTVLTSETYRRLGFVGMDAARNLGGVGGLAETGRVTTVVRFLCEDADSATFRGDFSAFVEPDVLDMSVLRCDIMDMFGVIVDRRSDVLALLGKTSPASLPQWTKARKRRMPLFAARIMCTLIVVMKSRFRHFQEAALWSTSPSPPRRI